MTRREFVMGVSSSAALLASRFAGHSAQAATSIPAELDDNPAGGFTTGPLKQLLFFDYRHIYPNDLNWRRVDGEKVPLDGTPEGPLPVYADTSEIAYGIRLAAQPATKEARIEHGAPGSVLYDGGLYRSWGMEVHYPPNKPSDPRSTLAAESITIRYGESKDGYAWDVRNVCELRPRGCVPAAWRAQ